MKQNIGMSISDGFSLIALLISVCAFMSPVVTALLNNHHQYKMKKLEYQNREQEEKRQHERDIYEGYIRAAGACVQFHSAENLKSFGEHSSLAAYYVPADVRADMLKLERIMRTTDGTPEKIELLAQIVQKIRAQRSKK